MWRSGSGSARRHCADSTPVLAALRTATSTIPIVFVIVNDPVGQGFIPNLTHPGGNVTGFSFIEPEILGKWINLLRDVKPDLSRVALMFNPETAPYYDRYVRSYKSSQLSVAVDPMHVRSVAEVDLAIADLGREPRVALIAASDPYILTVREAILKAADQHRIPLISAYKQFVAEGSLMSYGPDTADLFRRSSSYVDRILKGEWLGIYLCSRQKNSNSSSILKRPRCWVSRYVSHSCYSPMR